jgi:hypothetical protein
MRKLSIVILAASLLIGSGYALAQPQREGPGPQSGAKASPPFFNPVQRTTQLAQQLQQNIEQMQVIISKDKMAADDRKKMQDMFNQMQGMMNHLQIIAMVQMYSHPAGPQPAWGNAAAQAQPPQTQPPQTQPQQTQPKQ